MVLDRRRLEGVELGVEEILQRAGAGAWRKPYLECRVAWHAVCGTSHVARGTVARGSIHPKMSLTRSKNGFSAPSLSSSA